MLDNVLKNHGASEHCRWQLRDRAFKGSVLSEYSGMTTFWKPKGGAC